MLSRAERNDGFPSSDSAMFDLVDMLLLRRGIPSDDGLPTFRRIDGNPSSKIIYFLPWHTPFSIARAAGFLPLDFLAAYEMPPSIVSSEPGLCVEAMMALVSDAERLLGDHGVAGKHAVIVGLSVGSYPATYLACRIGGRLCAVASADRGDLVIWESFATRIVKHRAIQKGYGLAHYSKALLGTHPVENLRGLAPNSLFVFGRRDPFVPGARTNGLLSALEMHAPRAHVAKVHGGHFKTLVASGRYQRALDGVSSARTKWQVRLPVSLSSPQLRLSNSAELPGGSKPR
jgi:pimeloyl-ACP methyl ester carboxylesterase